MFDTDQVLATRKRLRDRKCEGLNVCKSGERSGNELRGIRLLSEGKVKAPLANTGGISKTLNQVCPVPASGEFAAGEALDI